jgi:putative ABC transport system permease protein
MKAKTAGKIAWAGLSRNRLRTFLMMVGIVVGITALTIVVSAGLGAQKRVMERVKKFGLSSLMVSAGGGMERGRTAGVTPAVTLKLADAVALEREIRNIHQAAPFARVNQADVSWSGRSSTAGVFGVTPAWAPVWDWDAAEGDFITEEDLSTLGRVAVLGPTARRDLFGDTNPIGETIQIGGAPFLVKGIMQAKGTSPGGGDMDNRVYVPLSTLMRRLANVDHLNGIKLRLRSAEEIDRTASAVRMLLRERHRVAAGLPDDFSITTPTEITQVAGKVAGTFNVFLVLVAAISLIAGGVVVGNIMLISVNDRRREIGLRKAVGARSADILQQFLLEATAVTLTGGLFGILIGAIGARIVQWVTSTPAALSWESVVVGVVSSAVVGVVAGVQPARRAARLTPVDALRV